MQKSNAFFKTLRMKNFEIETLPRETKSGEPWCRRFLGGFFLTKVRIKNRNALKILR